MFAFTLSLAVGGLLFLGACLGQLALVLTSHNYIYGKVLHEKLNDWLRLPHYLLIVSTPIVFWNVLGVDWSDIVTRAPINWGSWLLAGYFLLSAFVGLVVFPLLTLRRCCQRPVPQLASNHTQTHDISAQLGRKPVGRSKHGWLAKLPRNEVFQLDIVEKTLYFDNLPAAWDGLTILHLSDLHFIGTPGIEYFKAVAEHCAELKPDLLALTGDLVDSEFHHRWLVPILGRLRWKLSAFAILGNHDSWWQPPKIRRRLQKIGMQVVSNRWLQTEVRGEPMVVIGQEQPWFQPGPDLTTCPIEPFRLCLSHTPDNIEWCRRNQIHLMLSGHNHGGQIRLPVFGSVVVPSVYGRRFDCGLHYLPPTLLHVTRGIAGEHPLRYNCRPEVVLLVLKKRR